MLLHNFLVHQLHVSVEKFPCGLVELTHKSIQSSELSLPISIRVVVSASKFIDCLHNVCLGLREFTRDHVKTILLGHPTFLCEPFGLKHHLVVGDKFPLNLLPNEPPMGCFKRNNLLRGKASGAELSIRLPWQDKPSQLVIILGT